MEHVEVIADEVDSWTHKQGADAVLRLRGGRTLIAHTTDARFQAWSRVMSLQQETHWPVYAEYDAATRAIRLLLLCAPQHVESVESDAAGNMTVEFRRAPSFLLIEERPPGLSGHTGAAHGSLENTRIGTGRGASDNPGDPLRVSRQELATSWCKGRFSTRFTPKGAAPRRAESSQDGAKPRAVSRTPAVAKFRIDRTDHAIEAVPTLLARLRYSVLLR